MHIEKRGSQYRFIISTGKDKNGKYGRATMTFTPPKGLSAKQEKKAVTEAAERFERKIKGGACYSFERMSFREFYDLYSEMHLSNLKPNTANQYRIIAEQRLIPYFGSMQVHNITAVDIRLWIAGLKGKAKKGKAAISENSKGVWFRTLSAMLGKAVEWEIIDINPCTKVKAPRKPCSDVPAMQREEVIQLFEKLEHLDNPPMVITLYLLLLTGVRESEAAGLQWQDIDWENKIVHIQRECIYISGKGLFIDTPKSSNSVRDICAPDKLLIQLKSYRAWQQAEIDARGDLWVGPKGDQGFILTQFNGDPVHGSTIRFWVQKTAKLSGVPYVTVHGLRHTYASLLVANGIDARTTAAQLGHSSPALVYSTYANPQSEAKRRAASKIETLVDPSSEE